MAFTKQNLEDPEAQYQSPIGEDLRDMLNGFHQELLRHSNHPPPEEDELAKLEEAAAADAKQMSWSDKVLSLIMLIISKREEKQQGPVTDGPGIPFTLDLSSSRIQNPDGCVGPRHSALSVASSSASSQVMPRSPPWPSQLPLVAPQFPLYSLTRYTQWSSSQVFLNVSSNTSP